MTICQALDFAVKKLLPRLTKEGVGGRSNPHLDAEILLSHILKKPREYIIAYPKKNLTKTQVTNYEFQVARRINGEPIAYLTGHQEFYGLDFKVNKHVLIPRPETELMVDEALKVLKETESLRLQSNRSDSVSWRIIDVGTGTGCIIISLAKKLNIKSKTLNLKFYATDISKQALTLARRNAKQHNVHQRIKFHHGNLLEPILKNINPNHPIIITANLPYLTPTQIKNSPTIQCEPKLALSAGKDGLKYYRQLFKQITQITNYQLPITILLEIDESQTNKIKQLIKNKLPQTKFKIKKDLRGHNRLVVIQLN